MDTKQKKKKALAGAVAGVAALALVGGGTFALWSDFETDNGNQAKAGQLTLSVGENMTQSGALNLAPGQNRFQTRYIASNDGESVPNGRLFVTVTDVRDADDGCTSNSEPLIDDCNNASAGDLSREADFRFDTFAPAGPADNPCKVVAPGTEKTVHRSTLLGAEGTKVEVGTLAPGAGTCIQIFMSLRTTASDVAPAATNASQGDSSEFDIRYDLELAI